VQLAHHARVVGAVVGGLLMQRRERRRVHGVARAEQLLLRRGLLRMEAAQISPQGRDLSVVFVRREVEAPVDAAALDVPVV
jgi:hypothetical protein